MLLLCLKVGTKFYLFSAENQSPRAKWLVMFPFLPQILNMIVLFFQES